VIYGLRFTVYGIWSTIHGLWFQGLDTMAAIEASTPPSLLMRARTPRSEQSTNRQQQACLWTAATDGCSFIARKAAATPPISERRFGLDFDDAATFAITWLGVTCVMFCGYCGSDAFRQRVSNPQKRGFKISQKTNGGSRASGFSNHAEMCG
jgi:hypothetical protein